MKLPEMSVRNPVTTLMIFLGVILLGLFCFVQMPLNSLPEMDIPTITVMTPYEGAGPEEVEEKITRPLEERLATVEDLEHIYSVSREGMSIIRLLFSWETNLDIRSNDVRDAIDMAQQQIPEEADRSRIFKLDISQFPIMVYGVLANESYNDLEDILKDEVANPLEGIAGVGSVNVITPLRRRVNIDLDRERLASYQLTPDDVAFAVANENQEVSAGSIKMGSVDYLPRIPAEFSSVEPMKDIVVRAKDGAIVRLRDVGEVSDSFKDVDLSVRINASPGGIMLIMKQSDANTVKVARRVRAALADISERLPEDVKIVNVMDSSEDIRDMVRDLLWTLVLGGGLAMAAVLIFLGQGRATFIIALTIPFSLISAGIFMYMLDYTINMMTLFALIVAVGMVVDNAIVVLENIARHREEGESAIEGAVLGTSEVGMPIVASTLTTICVFFPLLFVRGIAEIIFVPFAVVATIVLLASLFTALTMTPMMSSKLLARSYGTGQKQGKFTQFTESWFGKLADGYSAVLGLCLEHRWLVILGVIGLFAVSVPLVFVIGWEFMPKQDGGMVQGTIELPVGTRVEVTEKTMLALYDTILEEIPKEQIIAFYMSCGSSESAFSTNQGTHVGNFGVRLVRKEFRDRNVMEIAEALRRRFNAVSPLYGIMKYSISLQDPMESMIMGGEQPLSVNILGDDLETSDRIAAELKETIKNIPNTVDIDVSRKKGAPEIWVEVDRQKASSMGLNVSNVSDTVRSSVYGRIASKYRVRGDEYDIFVRLREQDRQTPADIGQLPVRLPTGDLIRVENVAEIRKEQGPVQIDRKDQHRIVTVGGDVYGRSVGEVIAEVGEHIKKLDVPRGTMVTIAGQSEDIKEAFFWLSLALLVGSILVYMIMASQFESLIDPFVVMFSVPVAFIGVIWFLFFAGFNLNIIVFLGLLLLIGVVVNNAIVLVDYINILRARGHSMIDAVREAGRTRLRPVLMTAITTVLGLVPMAYQGGQGSEVWNPLGVTIIGGLSVSTLVTLILVPTVYSIFESHIKLRNHQ
jgi:hydrophobe/amphiphile efflux-1 (HAE1) family protein